MANFALLSIPTLQKYCLALILISSLNINHVLSEIIVYKNTSINKVVRVITDYELSIGADIPDDGIMAYIVSAEPENACTEIKPPPKDPFQLGNSLGNDSRFNWFVLVDRDYCVMDKKLKNVKSAGYNGVIIYNARLTQMNLPELDYQLVVDFPVLLVTHIDGKQIKTLYTYDKGYFAWFLNNSPFHIYPFLVPFLVVIGACIIVIISFMISQIIRCYNERRKRRRHRLAKRHLKKIPTINFKKGDHYEICAICLDEFKEGVKLRLLTCGHAYHPKCIDPWLTENRRNCPICKQKLCVPGITDSESENDAENERNNNATEQTPLLNNTNSSSQAQNESFASNLIFPIGRRTRRLGRAASGSNVPSTSNIVNNNDLIINVQAPVESIVPFRSNRSDRSDRSRRSLMQVNVEINSTQSTLNDEQPSTSSSHFQDESSSSSILNRTNSSDDSVINTSTKKPNVSSISNQPNNQPSTSNYGSTTKSRRQDNIV